MPVPVRVRNSTKLSDVLLTQIIIILSKVLLEYYHPDFFYL